MKSITFIIFLFCRFWRPNTVKMLTNNQLQAYLKVCPSTCSNNQGVPGKSHPWWRLTISITCYVSHTASSVARSSSHLKKSMSFLHNSIPTDAFKIITWRQSIEYRFFPSTIFHSYFKSDGCDKCTKFLDTNFQFNSATGINQSIKIHVAYQTCTFVSLHFLWINHWCKSTA